MTFSELISFFLLLLQVQAFSTPRNLGLVERQDLTGRPKPSYQCKCYDGEACWPSAGVWKTLNTTVDGQLQKVVPIAAVCYNSFEGKSYYNAAACANLIAHNTDQSLQIADPATALNVLYMNDTCVPTTDPTGSCTLGYRAEYVIVAKKKQHIAAGVKFASKYNLRLVIRNTGHDFMGRSTGYGALAINTHGFKDVEFTKKYTGPGKYRGSAVTVGAGIQGGEVYKLAFAQKPPVVVIGGECATVGFAGGYIQGGGHGPLSTYHGMAADQALSFDVITAKGEYVTANEDENPDLFWALKGGGAATYGVVTSLTVKTFPELPCAGTIININSTHTNDSVLFWKAAEVFHSLANHYTDNGMFVYYELLQGSLHVQPLLGPNMTAAKLKQVLKPLFDGLDALKVPYETKTKEFPTFWELYVDMFEPEFNAGTNQLTGGRFINRDDLTNNHPAIIDAYKLATNPPILGFGIIVGHIVGPGIGAPVVDNSIHPGWRKASSFSITATAPDASQWDTAIKVQRNITDTLDAASPKGGAYVNECDLYQPDWQTQNWGSNYPRLLRIRKKWDPEGVFYAQTTVGTEDWLEVGQPPKLCKKT
ncbi:FAD/FMN-containing isoamyl alcohol oxidase-like protein MreA [Halenospora varia]|nr:FAD/FMN-containing isoamyl alcohol oxidase-like protein MreA [Halenospora varia]